MPIPVATVRALCCLVCAVLMGVHADAARGGGRDDTTAPVGVLKIPRLERAPTLEDFLGMEAGNGLEGKLARVEQFIQRDPKDGEPATQRTVAYLGYDEKHLYVIFVAFDSQAQQVRARLTRREAIFDDLVQIIIDTFHDRRRAFFFFCNPLGIQADGVHTG